ncbi:hypothetical protein [Lysinibacillus fusiformis]|uniref:hypothetical protein n=1 Tax=Lysinibacillus fusiformis TaxID=28031 RepID=UPI00215A5524|nr:hypothetical protein [Lysinibacillus fusiformis]MCR8855297.1 hypothetical protein [Lysinibacillus fusiformis]WKT76066.1 hypothetical protein QYY55_18580 [Lysinibacillus fusiformis]
MTKKVLLIIVEGQTEQIILEDYLDAYFADTTIRFDVQREDVLTKWDAHKRIPNIKNSVIRVIQSYLDKYKFLAKDLTAVVHITDADGCFIAPECVRVDENIEQKLFYTEDAILVKSDKRKEQIEQRNEMKARNARILIANDYFSINRLKVPYQLFYFSTNLEHVLWDERNEIPTEKIHKADEFIENLSGTIEEYLKAYLPVDDELPYREKMKKSWSFLMEGGHSLQRGTNVPLLFEMIKTDVQ